MQIKANSFIGDVKLSNLKLEDIEVTELSTTQKQCFQSLKPLKEKDQVLVIFISEVKEGMSISLQEPYIILSEPSNVEDFIARLNTLSSKEQISEQA